VIKKTERSRREHVEVSQTMKEYSAASQYSFTRIHEAKTSRKIHAEAEWYGSGGAARAAALLSGTSGTAVEQQI
jgi:hypothetical protein